MSAGPGVGHGGGSGVGQGVVGLPELPGILTAADAAATARSIAAMQEPSGAIPWTPGGHTDIWNHVEAAMALLIGGQRAAAERALLWATTVQRVDGSWPMRIVAGEIDDHSGDSNASAYLAVGAWHHWLVCRDPRFIDRLWPAVRSGLDWVVSMQLPWGGIAWAQEWSHAGVSHDSVSHAGVSHAGVSHAGVSHDSVSHAGAPGQRHTDALLAGSSSIHHALRAGAALAELVGQPRPEWEAAGGMLAHAIAEHPDRFLDKSQFSMDWYYPILGGAVTGEDASSLLKSRWDDFVVPGLGIRCVDTDPWVTGAETCELAMALDCLGDRGRASTLVAEAQHLRTAEGAYWTGWVFPDQVFWPVEHTTYTAAAVLLALDALSNSTPGAGILRGDGLPEFVRAPSPTCGC